MNYQIYIPSHGRQNILNNKTLRFLEKNLIEIERIHILVSDFEEYKIYLDTLDATLYGKIEICELSLALQRQFIDSFEENGIHIIFMDDDIEFYEYDSVYNSLDESFKNELNISFIKNRYMKR